MKGLVLLPGKLLDLGDSRAQQGSGMESGGISSWPGLGPRLGRQSTFEPQFP